MTPLLKRPFADASDAVLVVDPIEDLVLYANRSAYELLGSESEDVLGLSPTALFPGQERALTTFLAKAVRTGYERTTALGFRRGLSGWSPGELSALIVKWRGRRVLLVLLRDRSDHRRSAAGERHVS